ncbi:hypothetical protein MRX96_051649 [Rhipicephalus microplus]
MLNGRKQIPQQQWDSSRSPRQRSLLSFSLVAPRRSREEQHNAHARTEHWPYVQKSRIRRLERSVSTGDRACTGSRRQQARYTSRPEETFEGGEKGGGESYVGERGHEETAAGEQSMTAEAGEGACFRWGGGPRSNRSKQKPGTEKTLRLRLADESHNTAAETAARCGQSVSRGGGDVPRPTRSGDCGCCGESRN